MAGGDTDSEYESGAPGPSTKKKLRTEIVHKKCVTTISRQGFKPNESQSTDDELRRLKKAPKSSAERAREFRARKALLKQQNKQEQEPDEDTRSAGPSGDNQVPGPSEIRTIEKRAKSAEATRRWREKKRGNREKKQAKSAAQRMREYRQRKKLAKKIQLKQRSGQDIDQGPSTINSISAELARRGNSQSQEQTKSDDDKADDDDEPPYKIKKEVADNTPQIKKLMQIKSYKQE